MQNDTVADTVAATFVAAYLNGFAALLAGAPGAGHLSKLAATAKSVPEPLLSDLAGLMAALDPDAVASTLAVRAREIADDGMRYDDATDFVRALCSEFQGYADEPNVTAEAVAELRRQERGRLH